MGQYCGRQKIQSNRLEDAISQAKNIVEQQLQLKSQIQSQRKLAEITSFISKIIIYDHRNLIDHLMNQLSKKKVLFFIQNWSSLNFQELDMIYQNLIKKDPNQVQCIFQTIKMPKIIQRQHIQRSQSLKKHYLNKGKDIYEQRKVAFCVFCSIKYQKQSSKSNQPFQKYLFELCKKLIHNQNDQNIPFLVFYADIFTYSKLKNLIRTTQLKEENYIIVLQQIHPVLNKSGDICLKNEETSQLLQMPAGNDEFMTAKYQGSTVIQILKQKKMQYVICLESEYLAYTLQYIKDQFFLGYLAQNNESFDILYKCTQKMSPTSIPQKHIYMSYNTIKLYQPQAGLQSTKPHSQQYPMIFWCGYFAFNLQKFNKIKFDQSQIDYTQCIKIKEKQFTYWNAFHKTYQYKQKCLVFQRPITNIFHRKALKVIGLE